MANNSTLIPIIEPVNIAESEGVIKLRHTYETLNSMQYGTRILFILSLIPTIVLLKKYKDGKALIVWIISFIICESAFRSTLIFGITGNETVGSLYKANIIIELLRIIPKLIPLIYSSIKLIINIKKDKNKKTSKGEN